MVAKDDNKDGSQEDKGKEGKKKEDAEDGEDQGEEKQPHALEEEIDVSIHCRFVIFLELHLYRARIICVV